MSRLLSSPVPQNLREMLKDYPEHAERTQEAPDPGPDRPSPAVAPFDRAIWSLKAERKLHRPGLRRCGAREQAEARKFSRDAARADIPVLSDLQGHHAFGESNERTTLNPKEPLFGSLDTIHVCTNAPLRLFDSGLEPLLQEQDFYVAVGRPVGGETVGYRDGKS